MAKLRLNYGEIKRNFYICFLCIYFTSKVMWDYIPYVFEFLTAALITIVAVKGILSNINILRNEIILYVLCVTYVLFSSFLNDSIQEIYRCLYEYIFYSMIFWAVLQLIKKARLLDYGKILIGFGMILAILSWIEYFSHTHIVPQTSNEVYTYEFRTIVFSRTILAHGMVLGFYALLCFYFYLDSKKIRFLTATVFMIVTEMTSGSRGPFVGCIVGIMVMALISLFYKRKLTIKIMLLMGIIAVALVVLFIFLSSGYQVSNPIINYFLNRVRSIADWENDAGNRGRIAIWTRFVKIWRENFWFGLGPSKTGSWNTVGKYGVTESGILKRFCELGLIGGILHYSFVIGIIWKAIIYLKKIFSMNKECIFYFGLAIAVLVNDVALQATEEIMIAFMMWYSLAGLTYCRTNR